MASSGRSPAVRRLRRLATPAAVSVLGLALLMSAQLTINRSAIESRLDNRVTEALTRAGIQGVDVTVSGRDVTMRGTAGTTVVFASAMNAAGGVEGVRRTLNQITVLGDVPQQPRGPSQVTAAIVRGEITLSGTVPGRGDRERLRDAAEDAVGEDNVEDRLSVDDGASAEGLRRFIALVRAFDPGGECQAELTQGVISLFGRVPRETSRDAMVGAANRVKNDAAGIVDQLAIDADTLPPEAVALQRRLADLPEIEFSAGGSRLDGGDEDIVERAAELLEKHASLRVRVEGHTADYGSSESNLQLSQDRAARVREALVEAGVAADRVDAVGYGEYRPAVDPTGVPSPDATDEDDDRRDVVFTVVLG
jgi:outer membrane protein OmpA-like peptidoglycan-associated protein/osmotically-inducible protein OsmY